MGGLGSGERLFKKPVVEGRYALDTADLKRWKLLAPGTTNAVGAFEWRRGGEEKSCSSVAYAITVRPTDGTLRLMYALKAETANLYYTIRLVATPCHLGGVRWWFTCPLSKGGVACGRRARKLYLGGRHFGCRQCQGLTYRSRQESDARVYALARAGLDALPRTAGASVAQLGVMLKALTLVDKRLKRFTV